MNAFKRTGWMTLTCLGLASFIALAQDEDRLQKKTAPKKDAVEPMAPAEPEPKATKEKPEEIVKRVRENMNATVERLEKKDTGDKTRQIQQDIVKDLETLIKQAENQQQQSGGGGGQSKPSMGSKNNPGGSQSQPQGQGNKPQPSPSPGSQSKPGAEKQPGQGRGKEEGKAPGQGKDAGKEPGGNGKGKEPGEQGDENDGRAGGNTTQKKDKNTVADLFKDVWGHLPAARRMEMDAYSREKFMSKYEDLLREYYRTIAERGRRQGE